MPLRSLKSASGEIAAQRPMCGRNGNCSPSFFPSLLLSCTLFTTTRCSFLHLLFVRPFDVRPKQTQDFFEAFSLVRKQQHRSASGGGDGLAHTAEQTMHFDAMGPSFLRSFDPFLPGAPNDVWFSFSVPSGQYPASSSNGQPCHSILLPTTCIFQRSQP